MARAVMIKASVRESDITNASFRVRVSRFGESDVTKASGRVRDTTKASVRDTTKASVRDIRHASVRDRTKAREKYKEGGKCEGQQGWEESIESE
jgi:hypothetical protein